MSTLDALLTPYPSSTYVLWTVRVCAVGVAITTLEFLLHRDQLADSGLMSWPVNRVDMRLFSTGVLARGASVVFAYPMMLGLLGGRLVLALIHVFAPVDLALHPALVAFSAVCSLIVPIRSRFGLDAADQVNVLVFGGLTLVNVSPTPVTRSVYLWFLLGQCCLAYGVAGVSKIVSQGWRNGTHLQDILNIRTYSYKTVARFARAHPRLVRWASWSVIGYECVFVLVLVLPAPYALAFVAAGLMFHLAIAVIMGLNDFVWAFASTYPAILFWLTSRLHVA